MQKTYDIPMTSTEAAFAATAAPSLNLDGSRRLGHVPALARRCIR